MIVFEQIGRLLLFLHLVAAVCATAAVVHLAIRVFGYMAGRYIKISQEKVFARLLLISYGLCYALGAVLYPNFRIRVRRDYFDAVAHMNFATGLFEAKEHLATLGLVATLAIWIFSKLVDRPSKPENQKYLPAYGALIAFMLAILAYNVWSGWYLTVLRSV